MLSNRNSIPLAEAKPTTAEDVKKAFLAAYRVLINRPRNITFDLVELYTREEKADSAYLATLAELLQYSEIFQLDQCVILEKEWPKVTGAVASLRNMVKSFFTSSPNTPALKEAKSSPEDEVNASYAEKIKIIEQAVQRLNLARTQQDLLNTSIFMLAKISNPAPSHLKPDDKIGSLQQLMKWERALCLKRRDMLTKLSQATARLLANSQAPAASSAAEPAQQPALMPPPAAQPHVRVAPASAAKPAHSAATNASAARQEMSLLEKITDHIARLEEERDEPGCCVFFFPRKNNFVSDKEDSLKNRKINFLKKLSNAISKEDDFSTTLEKLRAIIDTTKHDLPRLYASIIAGFWRHETKDIIDYINAAQIIETPQRPARGPRAAH